MTAQSSSKSYFGAYLKYRLGSLKINFVMCCILNVLGLPFYALSANKGFGGAVSEFAMTGRIFSTICIVALLAVAIMNAILSFDYYCKKDLTDTIGALPLTCRERFFADLLAGYSVNVVPLVPCGILCAVMFGTMQDKIEGGIRDFSMAGLGGVIFVLLFLIVTFVYLFSVFITVCCGKAFHSVVFSVLGMAVLPLFFGGLTRCFANRVIGIDSNVYFSKTIRFFPPIGLIGELFDAMGFPFDYRAADPLSHAGEIYAVIKPIYFAVYVLLAAGIIAGAYLLAKRRLAENTGSAFAIKPMFWVLSGGITAGATIMMFTAVNFILKHYILVSVATGLVVCLVTILLCPQKKKEILRSIITGAAAVAVMLGAWVLIDKTGSFGARYLPESSDKIEYVKINNTYTISDKEDIEKYISLLNDRLRTDPSDLEFERKRWLEPGYYVEVKTTDGKTVERLYGSESTGRQIFSNLDGYVDYFFDELESASYELNSYLEIDKNTFVVISKEKTAELIDILRGEALEKHDPNAKKFADIVFSEHGSGRGERTFVVEENFTRTIAFIDDTGDYIGYDPELMYLSISYRFYGEEWDYFSVKIPFKDKDNEKVQELIALLEDNEGENLMSDFKITAHYVSKGPGVTLKNKERVLELMKEIAADYLND